MRHAIALAAIVAFLAVAAWSPWRDARTPAGHPLAGTYRIEESVDPLGWDLPSEELEQLGPLISEAMEEGELSLHSDQSITWSVRGWGWAEKGRWEVRDDRVHLFFKREGRDEWPLWRSGLQIRDETLVLVPDAPTGQQPLLVLRRQ